jgi:hypothetical protein
MSVPTAAGAATGRANRAIQASSIAGARVKPLSDLVNIGVDSGKVKVTQLKDGYQKHNPQYVLNQNIFHPQYQYLRPQHRHPSPPNRRWTYGWVWSRQLQQVSIANYQYAAPWGWGWTEMPVALPSNRFGTRPKERTVTQADNLPRDGTGFQGPVAPSLPWSWGWVWTGHAWQLAAVWTPPFPTNFDSANNPDDKLVA